MTLRLALLSLHRISKPKPPRLPTNTFTYTLRALSNTAPSLSTTPMAAESDTLASTATADQITPESLSATLSSKLNTTHIDIQDISGGCGQAFNAIVVSDDFKSKSLLQRHRLVNNALKEEIKAIHAWTPRCLTVEQWEKEKEGL